MHYYSPSIVPGGGGITMLWKLGPISFSTDTITDEYGQTVDITQSLFPPVPANNYGVNIELGGIIQHQMANPDETYIFTANNTAFFSSKPIYDPRPTHHFHVTLDANTASCSIVDGTTVTVGYHTITAVPNSGYTILDVTLNGTSVGNNYTFTAADQDYTIVVTTTPILYNVNATLTVDGTPCPGMDMSFLGLGWAGGSIQGSSVIAILSSPGTMNATAKQQAGTQFDVLASASNLFTGYISMFTINGANLLINQTPGFPDEFNDAWQWDIPLGVGSYMSSMPAMDVNIAVAIKSTLLCVPGLPPTEPSPPPPHSRGYPPPKVNFTSPINGVSDDVANATASYSLAIKSYISSPLIPRNILTSTLNGTQQTFSGTNQLEVQSGTASLTVGSNIFLASCMQTVDSQIGTTSCVIVREAAGNIPIPHPGGNPIISFISPVNGTSDTVPYSVIAYPLKTCSVAATNHSITTTTLNGKTISNPGSPVYQNQNVALRVGANIFLASCVQDDGKTAATQCTITRLDSSTVPTHDTPNPHHRGPDPVPFDRVAPDQPRALILRWRNEDGRWSKEHVIDLGKTGNTNCVQMLEGMGRYQARQYEIVHVDRVPCIIAALEEDIVKMEEP
jgi:hypothetical protein